MSGKADEVRQSAARCERCGVELTERERAGGWPICDACYAVRGSCCPEFGPDDLTGDEAGRESGGGPGKATP